MRKTNRYSAKRIGGKNPFLVPKTGGVSWKMRATRLEHRRVEGKK